MGMIANLTLAVALIGGGFAAGYRYAVERLWTFELTLVDGTRVRVNGTAYEVISRAETDGGPGR